MCLKEMQEPEGYFFAIKRLNNNKEPEGCRIIKQ